MYRSASEHNDGGLHSSRSKERLSPSRTHTGAWRIHNDLRSPDDGTQSLRSVRGVAAVSPTVAPALLSANTAAMRPTMLVAVYEASVDVAQAVNALRALDADCKHVSVIGKDYHPDKQWWNTYTTAERMKAWGVSGAFWGGMWSQLFGSAFFVPGVGPVLAAGLAVAWIDAALRTSPAGVPGALVSTLSREGIPEPWAHHYNDQVRAGRFLVVARLTCVGLENARASLKSSKHCSVDVY